LIALYVEEAQGLLARLRAAVAVGDAPGVRAAAHSLKGDSGYAGAEEVMALSAALESLGSRDPLTDEASALLRQLEEAFDRARRAFTAELSG